MKYIHNLLKNIPIFGYLERSEDEKIRLKNLKNII